MSCYGCGTEYSFFKKEFGCENCGFSFCKACLDFKYPVPAKQNRVGKVCINCKKKIENPGAVATPAYELPANFVKRLEVLEQKDKAPKNVAKTGGNKSTGTGKRNAAAVDTAIRSRLDNLKNKIPSDQIPSVDEIRARLDKLRGVNSEGASTGQESQEKVHISAGQHLSEEEQTEELLTQIFQEVDIDSGLSAGISGSKNKSKTTNSNVPNDDLLDIKHKKFIEEDKNLLIEAQRELENARRLGMDKDNKETGKGGKDDKISEKSIQDAIQSALNAPDSEEDTASDDDRTCCICENPAVLRCPKCAGDMYCRKCFKQGHGKSTDHHPAFFV